MFCSTIVFTRGSFATWSACRPPQLQPDSATSAGSMRPKNGLPDRAFSASAQSIASVRSDAFVRGGWICAAGRLRRGTRLSRRSARSAQDAAARDHEIAVRGDLEQMQPGCSRRRRNIRRCPRRRRPASSRRARRDLSGDRRREPAATRLPLSSRGNVRCPACRADCCWRRAAARPRRRPWRRTRARRGADKTQRGGYHDWSCAAVSHRRRGDEDQAFV